MAKKVTTRRGGITVSRKGKIGYRSPSVRVGGRRSGVNIGRRGVSGTVGTSLGSYNTKRGCRMKAMLAIGIIAGMLGIVANRLT